MKLLEIARGSAFWLMDYLKGGKIKAYYDFLRKYWAGGLEPIELENYQNDRINNLLVHAKTTVPMYAGINSNVLSDWPVMNKKRIVEKLENSLSTVYQKEQLIKMTTSGSTGTPFTSYQNSEKKKRVNAETLFFNGLVGYKVGRRIVHFRAVPKEVQKDRISQLKENIMLIDCSKMDKKSIEDSLKQLSSYTSGCGAMLMGYSSTFDAFAKYFRENGYGLAEKCKVYGIVGGSTMLYDETREEMERAFNCKCVSRYANMENGFLAQDEQENNIFIPNFAHYYFEILKLDEDIPAGDDEVGRIVVTDFFNYAQPMIRYDTGDVGAWTISKNGKKAIGKFGGRILDQIYDMSGNLVSSHAITRAMASLNGIEQYQFAQTGTESYEIRIKKVEHRFVDEHMILSSLKKVVGEKANISAVYMQDISAMSSGKRRYVVNEME